MGWRPAIATIGLFGLYSPGFVGATLGSIDVAVGATLVEQHFCFGNFEYSQIVRLSLNLAMEEALPSPSFGQMNPPGFGFVEGC